MIEFWRSRLSDSSKKQYDILLNAIRQQQRSVDLIKTQNIVNEISKIYNCVICDHPELYYASPQIAIAMRILSLNANLSYLYNAKQKQEIDKSFDSLHRELTKELNKSDIEKAYTAAFLIMKNSRYEINNTYNQNAASAIYYHVAQCSGFALAFKYAMDFMGIWCIVVSGSVSIETRNNPHAWNIVKLNDAYYHIDITTLANLTLIDINQLYQRRLFESDEKKKQQGYVWDFSETPTCTEMDMRSYAPSNASVNNAHTARSKKTINDSSLQTFTRLFDVQAKVRECLKNRITYYEFILNIPMYSNEKLMRILSNYILELGKELSVSYNAKAEYIDGRFHLEINYDN